MSRESRRSVALTVTACLSIIGGWRGISRLLAVIPVNASQIRIMTAAT